LPLPARQQQHEQQDGGGRERKRDEVADDDSGAVSQPSMQRDHRILRGEIVEIGDRSWRRRMALPQSRRLQVGQKRQDHIAGEHRDSENIDANAKG